MELAEVFEYILNVKANSFLRTWMLECFGNRKTSTGGNIHIKNYDGHPVAKLFCLNVIFEIKFENITRANLKRMLLELDQHIERSTNSRANALTKVQNFSAFNDQNLCQCEEPDMSGIEDLSRVVSADHIIFLWNNLPGVIPWNEEINSPKIAETLRDEMRRRQSMGLSLGPFQSYYLNLFWFSKDQDLRQWDHLPTGGTKANSIRDALGLAHMRSGYAIEVKFKKNHLNKAATPTFFDSGPYEYFCRAKKADRWGRTRQLPTLQEGLSEAVYFRTDWPYSFDFNFLGPVSFPQLPTEDDWNNLVINLWNELVKFYPELPDELITSLPLPR